MDEPSAGFVALSREQRTSGKQGGGCDLPSSRFLSPRLQLITRKRARLGGGGIPADIGPEGGYTLVSVWFQQGREVFVLHSSPLPWQTRIGVIGFISPHSQLKRRKKEEEEVIVGLPIDRQDCPPLQLLVRCLQILVL
ncbi:unnamed protein product [Pleuronectes platessa]|uniref:Uncharacterized protein n=1 Tax=Pleuronectes platessa TaxID=8262 RepID=A0A9N7ULV5_PLEPL|nr:unnamed protein product [Pleuronectes platessa]